MLKLTQSLNDPPIISPNLPTSKANDFLLTQQGS